MTLVKKLQRAGAVQDASHFSRSPNRAQRPGLRRPSAAFPGQSQKSIVILMPIVVIIVMLILVLVLVLALKFEDYDEHEDEEDLKTKAVGNLVD